MAEATPKAVVAGTVTSPPILLVEDDKSQALLVERVLAKAGLMNPVRAFDDGADALAYLSSLVPSAEANGDPLPALLLLDLHLPRKSGLEILAWFRQQRVYEATPVIMLSGSTESEDIDQAFELGADSYLVKPVAFDALVDSVTGLGLPWMIFQREGSPER